MENKMELINELVLKEGEFQTQDIFMLVLSKIKIGGLMMLRVAEIREGIRSHFQQDKLPLIRLPENGLKKLFFWKEYHVMKK